MCVDVWCRLWLSGAVVYTGGLRSGSGEGEGFGGT